MKRDIEYVLKLHNKHFDREFHPDELKRFTTSFAAVDDNDQIIIAAGVTPILEAITITDKDAPLELKYKLLAELLETIKVTTRLAGYDELHCFVQNPAWVRHLIHHAGFKPTKGQSLVLGV